MAVFCMSLSHFMFGRLASRSSRIRRLQSFPAAPMLRHGPIALFPVQLLVGWAVQTPDHVPSGASTSLADLDAALCELDHHVVRG
eukprot:CAMPEP_0206520570 /NCGR_PEP_ID=MMETSP0324_2-20121206/65825_1 /ASSEMBLY_ACC=CAM_ASM_000836 /TAXON_ID=2866 /ORGANISM="Crypthecodinium cohnii, Strain Seligo" /LENGTH=84 /DNA_ID=CAMNT_0054014287 /DNA_START=86 /DNA_END=340 /DNA_ORIENTATION=+